MTVGIPPQNLQPDRYLGPGMAVVAIISLSREPVTTDKYYPLGTLALIGENPTTGTTGDMWYLSDFTSSGAIWVKIATGVVFESFQVQAATAPGVNPVTPTVLGLVTINGSAVAAHSVPLETRTRALNAFNVEVQVASDRTGAPANSNDAGICSFDDVKFLVDANGYVTTTSAVGDVVGPAGATDNAICRFDGATGKLIQNSVVTIADSGSTTFTATSVGSNAFAQFVNTDNTSGSSGALFYIRSAGASGGDCWYAWGIDGVIGYSFGIDNSDNDSLKETNSNAGPSNGNVLRVMTSAGEQTLPLQPAFQARLSATTANDKTGNGTAYTLICDTETFDQGGDYDNATGIFTAPVAGRYVFTARLAWNNVVAQTSYNLLINTSNRQYSTIYSAVVFTGLHQNATEFCDMDAGDTCSLIAVGTGEGADTVGFLGSGTNAVTYFAGYLEC